MPSVRDSTPPGQTYEPAEASPLVCALRHRRWRTPLTAAALRPLTLLPPATHRAYSGLCWDFSLGGEGGGAAIGLVTVASGLPVAVGASVRSNRLRYAALHGYAYCEITEVLDTSRAPAWTKVLAVLATLEGVLGESGGAALHLDADAVVRDFSVDAAELLRREGGGADVLFSADFNTLGPDGRKRLRVDKFHQPADATNTSTINSGVYFARATPWAKRFLREVRS